MMKTSWINKIENKKIKNEILNKFYDVDKKQNTVTAKIVFDSFSELIDEHFGDDSVEKLNSLFFETIETAFMEIPINYYINLQIEIKEFGEYKQEEAEEIIINNLKLKLNTLKIQDRKKKLNSLFLSLVGGSILCLSYFLNDLNLPQIIFDIVNISGTLLVWEGASMFLLERGSNKHISNQYRIKLAKVELIDV